MKIFYIPKLSHLQNILSLPLDTAYVIFIIHNFVVCSLLWLKWRLLITSIIWYNHPCPTLLGSRNIDYLYSIENF